MKSEVKTKLDNIQYIAKALTNLGYKYQVAKEGQTLSTRGYYKNTKSNVEVLITELPNGRKTNNEIGLSKQKDGTYMCTGDYYSSFVGALTAEKLVNDITVEAKKEEVNDQLMALGFSMNDENHHEDELELTFTRWE